MFRERHKLQILDSIVGSVAIKVMDMLGGQKFSAEMSLHDCPMLPFSFVSIANTFVALIVNPTSRLFDSAWKHYIRVAVSAITSVVHSAESCALVGAIASSDYTGLRCSPSQRLYLRCRAVALQARVVLYAQAVRFDSILATIYGTGATAEVIVVPAETGFARFIGAAFDRAFHGGYGTTKLPICQGAM